jgi:beta-aspartyl-peptidase (threonine type)
MEYGIITHGGVGSPLEAEDGCILAAGRGMEVLEARGSALDSVVEAVTVLEDFPRFNAGTGSRPRLNGICEMDAAVMTSDGSIGGVAMISWVKNPIQVARKVMEETPHVLLAGEGALAFARDSGFAFHDPITPYRLERLEKLRVRLLEEGSPYLKYAVEREPGDTVGAVAMDGTGTFAAANSTGGVELMLPGRVGDSPIPGAGFYAGPAGAVATTGMGEEIIRRMSAVRVYDAIEAGMDPGKACRTETDRYPGEFFFGIIAITAAGPVWSDNRTMPVGVRVL